METLELPDEIEIEAGRTRSNAQVLVLAPAEKTDVAVIRDILSGTHYSYQVCESVDELEAHLGTDTRAILATEGAITERMLRLLTEIRGPSGRPLLFLVVDGSEPLLAPLDALDVLALDASSDITILERPVRRATLVTLLRAALQGADRQRQFHDRIGRLQSEYETLQKREQRLRYALQAGGLGIFAYVPSTDTLQLSARAQTLLDLQSDPASLVPVFRRIHPDDRPAVASMIRQAFGPDGTGTLDVTFRIKTERVQQRWLAATAELQIENTEPPARVISGTLRDVTDRYETEEAHRAKIEQLQTTVADRTRRVRRLAQKLTEAEQNERERVSQVLHDDLQQLLHGAQMWAQGLREDPSSTTVEEATGRIDELLNRALSLTRSLISSVNPPVLRSSAMAEILRWLALHMEKTHGLTVSLDVEQGFTVADKNKRTLLFQVTRELLFNVVKHAGVDRATVRARERADDYVVQVEDKGKGFDAEAASLYAESDGGFGLPSIRERLELLDGALEIDSAPGVGTSVTVRIPKNAIPEA